MFTYFYVKQVQCSIECLTWVLCFAFEHKCWTQAHIPVMFAPDSCYLLGSIILTYK